MQRRQRADEVGRKRFPPRALDRLALGAPRQRGVALDLLTQEEGCANDLRIVTREIDARRWNFARRERAERLEFRHCAIGREEPVRRADAKDGYVRAGKTGERNLAGDP